MTFNYEPGRGLSKQVADWLLRDDDPTSRALVCVRCGEIFYDAIDSTDDLCLVCADAIENKEPAD